MEAGEATAVCKRTWEAEFDQIMEENRLGYFRAGQRDARAGAPMRPAGGEKMLLDAEKEIGPLSRAERALFYHIMEYLEAGYMEGYRQVLDSGLVHIGEAEAGNDGA